MLLRGIGLILPLDPTENVMADHVPDAFGAFSEIVNRIDWMNFFLKLILNW